MSDIKGQGRLSGGRGARNLPVDLCRTNGPDKPAFVAAVESLFPVLNLIFKSRPLRFIAQTGSGRSGPNASGA